MKKYILLVVLLIILFFSFLFSQSSIYEMSAEVVSGTNVIGVNSTKKMLDFGNLSRNIKVTRYLTVNNNGNKPVYVLLLKGGELAQLVDADRLVLIDGNKQLKIPFELFVPSSAEIKKYLGKVSMIRIPKIF